MGFDVVVAGASYTYMHTYIHTYMHACMRRFVMGFDAVVAAYR